MKTLPTTPYLTGKQWMEQTNVVDKVGEIPKIIHQTWKSEYMKPECCEWFDKWKNMHPDFTHVLWLDEDNDCLARTHFPQFVLYYDTLPLIIQKIDFVRLMYLYKYGGVYVDLDYECFQNIVPKLPQTNGFMAVKSDDKFVVNEILQNSLMISEVGHPFVMDVLNLITETTTAAYISTTNPHYTNPFTGPLASTVSVIKITGPCTLDKTYVRSALKRSSYISSVTILSDEFMNGIVAKHHCHATWLNIPSLLSNAILLLTAIIVIIIVITVLITIYSYKHNKG